MRNRYKIILPLAFILLFIVGAKEKEPVVPYGLMVEFIREPENIIILDLKPELTWIVPAKARFQTAYQILVSSNRQNIENNKGDVWNSGKVLSHNSVEVETGIDLQANSTYFWKVRIWNNKYRSAGYSVIQQFSTGNPGGYQSTPNRFVFAYNEPSGHVKFSDRHWLYDFGKDAFGTLLSEYHQIKMILWLFILVKKLLLTGRSTGIREGQ